VAPPALILTQPSRSRRLVGPTSKAARTVVSTHRLNEGRHLTACPANMIPVTGVFLAEAASTLLEEDVQLPGGIYTAACLGQGFIDRLDKAGFKIETKSVTV
jgi:short subunit dehydrogenase-like uncharacterized protein